MAQFLIAVVYDPADGEGNKPADEAYAEVTAFNEALMADGSFVFAGGLTPPADGVTVRPGGRLTDGPARPEGKQLGGFWVVSVDNRAAAEALAVRAAAACGREVELRELAGD